MFIVIGCCQSYNWQGNYENFDQTLGKHYCLLNLSGALVLFANPAIYASSSRITCKDSFLIVLSIANSTSKIIYNQIRSLKPRQVSSKKCVRKQHKSVKQL